MLLLTAKDLEELMTLGVAYMPKLAKQMDGRRKKLYKEIYSNVKNEVKNLQRTQGYSVFLKKK